MALACVELRVFAARGRLGGAPSQQGAFAAVAGQRRACFERRSRLLEAAALVEQVAPNAREQVIALERRFGRNAIHDRQRRFSASKGGGSQTGGRGSPSGHGLVRCVTSETTRRACPVHHGSSCVPPQARLSRH